MLKEYELGKDGVAYVRSSLADGSALMRELLCLELEKGRVWTFLPEGVAEESLTEFSSGGVATGQLTVIRERVAELLLAHLSSFARSLVVFEDFMHEPGSKFLAGQPYLVYGSEVNLFVDVESAPNVTDIQRTMKKASQYTSRATLTSLDGGLEVSSGKEVTLDFLRALARNARYILVGAYDEESCVIWTRGNN